MPRTYALTNQQISEVSDQVHSAFTDSLTLIKLLGSQNLRNKIII